MSAVEENDAIQREQHSFDGEQALADLEQSIADREQGLADRDQRLLDTEQADEDRGADPVELSSFTQEVERAHRTAARDRAQMRRYAHQQQLDQSQSGRDDVQDLLDHDQVELENAAYLAAKSADRAALETAVTDRLRAAERRAEAASRRADEAARRAEDAAGRLKHRD